MSAVAPASLWRHTAATSTIFYSHVKERPAVWHLFHLGGAKWTASVAKLRQIARFNLESAGKRRAGSDRFDGNMPAVTHDCGRAQTRGNTCSKRSVCTQCSINFLCEITGVLCLYMQQCPPVVAAGKVNMDFFSFFFSFLFLPPIIYLGSQLLCHF